MNSRRPFVIRIPSIRSLRKRDNILFLALALIITLGCVIAVANDSLPRGVEGEWEWRYLPLNTYEKLWVPMTIFIGFLLVTLYIIKVDPTISGKRESLILLALVLMAFSINMGVFYVRENELGLSAIIRSPIITSYYTVAHDVTDIIPFLRDYVSLMPTFSPPAIHAEKPPGPIIFCWLVDQIPYFSNEIAATVIGLLIPLISSFTIIPLFYLGKEIYGRKVGLYASLLYGVIPSIIMFTPEFDQIYTLFSVSMLCSFYIGLNRRRIFYIFLSGLVFSLSLSFSFIHLIFLPMVVLLTIFLYINNRIIIEKSHTLTIKIKKKQEDFPFMIKAVFSFIVGLSIFYILFLLLNLNLFEVYQYVSLGNIQFQLKRTYSKWVVYNLFDFFIFVGIPTSMLFFRKFLKSLINLLKDKRVKSSDLVFITFLLTLLALNILGITPGEVARLWIFLVPFVALSSASVISDKHEIIMILILQFIQTIAFRIFLGILVR